MNDLIKELRKSEIDDILINHYKKMLHIKNGSIKDKNDYSYAELRLSRKHPEFIISPHKSISKLINKITKQNRIHLDLMHKMKLPGLAPNEVKANKDFKKWW